MSDRPTCPDWRAVAARRDAAEGDGPTSAADVAWERAVAHLDACPACFDDAVAAEPTLLFRRLPRGGAGADDVAAMKRGVAALVRAHEIEHPPRRARGVVQRLSRRLLSRRLSPAGRAWLSAAAAVLTLGGTVIVADLVGGLPGDAPPTAPLVAPHSPAVAAAPPAAAGPADAFAFASRDGGVAADAATTFTALPLYEDLGASGEMIQLVDHDRDILVFVSDDLDV